MVLLVNKLPGQKLTQQSGEIFSLITFRSKYGRIYAKAMILVCNENCLAGSVICNDCRIMNDYSAIVNIQGIYSLRTAIIANNYADPEWYQQVREIFSLNQLVMREIGILYS